MKKILLTLIVIGVIFVKCSELEKAKNYGGTAEITLPRGEKLITITWKDDSNLWYLTKPMNLTDSAEIYYFREKDDDNNNEGTVIIHEQK